MSGLELAGGGLASPGGLGGAGGGGVAGDDGVADVGGALSWAHRDPAGSESAMAVKSMVFR
jgi:hypothetical protein